MSEWCSNFQCPHTTEHRCVCGRWICAEVHIEGRCEECSAVLCSGCCRFEDDLEYCPEHHMKADSMTRLQAGLNAISAVVEGTDDPSKLLIAAKCRGLLYGYNRRWVDAPIEVIDVERVVTVPLYNIDTGKQSRTFTIGGKMDVRARRNGRRLIIDHKTTSESIEDPNEPYWRQLVVESQPSHYMWLDWVNGEKSDEAMWDVVRKPSIAPKQVTKADRALLMSSGLYFGTKLSIESLAEVRQTERESLEMYTARLAHDCSEIRPHWYFQRRTVPRLDAELHEYAAELWDTSQEIISARRNNRWGRSPEACMHKHSPCKFLGICSGHDSTDSDNWRLKSNVHSELPGIPGNGRVLTNTRLSTFRLCRRKHFYSYELGIERQDAEEAESLYFGNVWHLAQEAWWNAGKVINGNCNDVAGIESASATAELTTVA